MTRINTDSCYYLRNQRDLRAKYSCHADDADNADFLLIIYETTLLSLKYKNML